MNLSPLSSLLVTITMLGSSAFADMLSVRLCPADAEGSSSALRGSVLLFDNYRQPVAILDKLSVDSSPLEIDVDLRTNLAVLNFAGRKLELGSLARTPNMNDPCIDYPINVKSDLSFEVETTRRHHLALDRRNPIVLIRTDRLTISDSHHPLLVLTGLTELIGETDESAAINKAGPDHFWSGWPLLP